MSCSVNNLFNTLSKKWNAPIIEELNRSSSLGFNQLLGKIKLITPKTLSQNLKLLEKQKLLTKSIRSIDPLRVAYDLTEKGRKCHLIIENIKQLERAGQDIKY